MRKYNVRMQPIYFLWGKSLLHLLNYGVDYLTPSTVKRSILFPELFKTGQITPSGGFQTMGCYSNSDLATVPPVLSFLFNLFRLNL
jgi:hypothetical protein